MEGNGERNVWGDGEVHVLLDIWGDKAILDKMDGTSRNSQIYKTIAKRMEDCGFTRTVNQIKYKMKNLKKEYRKYVDHNNGPLTPQSVQIHIESNQAKQHYMFGSFCFGAGFNNPLIHRYQFYQVTTLPLIRHGSGAFRS